MTTYWKNIRLRLLDLIMALLGVEEHIQEQRWSIPDNEVVDGKVT